MKPKSIKFAAMTIQEAKERLQLKLNHIYEQREAANITDWVLENLTGWKKIDRVINKLLPLSLEQQESLEKYIGELLDHRPVQYVLGEAWFQGMRFFVNESTLIPRPETEELVEWFVDDCRRDLPAKEFTLLDVGTGSGCIPISIQKKLPLARVISCDISRDAIEVATKNATELAAKIEFIESDILDESTWMQYPQLDMIISNPPYIPTSDSENMSANVLRYEPHQALFVPENNALIFYEAIANLALNRLKPGGHIYFEIHENLAEQVTDLLRNKGFIDVIVRKDMQGKDRMVRCGK